MNKTMIAVLVATLVAPFALAEHAPQGPCDSGDAPALGMMQIDAPNGGVYYLDDRSVFESIWIYEETNGIVAPGDVAHSLQRGGSSPYTPDNTDTCVDDPLVTPDTVVF